MSNAPSSEPIKFSMRWIFYGLAVIASSLATFGEDGILFGVAVLVVWFLSYRLRTEGPIALGFIIVGLLVWLLPISPLFDEPSNREQSLRCMLKMKQLEIAIESYRTANGWYPPVFTTDKEGNRRHSWRVLLLPYLEEQMVHAQYRFDESWDSMTNSKLLEFTPEVYRCLHHDGATNTCDYELIVTDGTFDKPASLVVVEAARPVPWTKPTSLSADRYLEQISSNKLPWHFGHHDRRGFVEYGWTFHTAILQRPSQSWGWEVIGSDSHINQTVLTALGRDRRETIRIGGDRPHRRIVPERLAQTGSWTLLAMLTFLPAFTRRRKPNSQHPHIVSSGVPSRTPQPETTE